MRQQRTIYFNDARHYYLFAFEPPMALEDAWVPIDEVAGTGVDTFAYGVERGDGLFYPSRVGMMFGADIQPFDQAAYWRTWHNMQSLIERGLDPLTVLIDRAHDREMDFWASLRMAAYGNMDPAHKLADGGGGLAHAEVRAHILQVVEELATEYETDGIELDFALPGGTPRILREEDVEATTPILTDYVEQLAERVRGQRSGVVGARVLPTEEMNRAQGLDVRTWLERGLVDFLVPMRYGYMILDGDMPIDWLVEAAHAADAAVYGSLQPYVSDEWGRAGLALSCPPSGGGDEPVGPGLRRAVRVVYALALRRPGAQRAERVGRPRPDAGEGQALRAGAAVSGCGKSVPGGAAGGDRSRRPGATYHSLLLGRRCARRPRQSGALADQDRRSGLGRPLGDRDQRPVAARGDMPARVRL